MKNSVLLKVLLGNLSAFNAAKQIEFGHFSYSGHRGVDNKVKAVQKYVKLY